MKQRSIVVAIACATAVAVPATAFAANDPLATVKADLAKLTADASAAEATVAADAQGSDLAQLKRDAAAGSATLKTDWKLLVTDATAARKAAGESKELRSLLQAARTQVKGFRSAVRSAFVQSKRAAKQNKGSNGSKGKPASPGSDSHESGG